MELIGIHITKSPVWPVKIVNPEKVPRSAILIHTCNRVQYLCEGPERKAILECLQESGIHVPDIITGRECMRKLFDISFGLDSLNQGNSVIRRQLLESKNDSGTPRLKKVLTDIVDISNSLIPPRGYRQFEAAIKFFKILGMSSIHIVTGGETIGKNSYPVWHPDAFKCDAVILVGRVDQRFHEANIPLKCRYCINFNTRFDPTGLENITHLFDSYVAYGTPFIVNTDRIADMYWQIYENGLMKKEYVRRMKNMGISSAEISCIFSLEKNPRGYE